jgi:type II secretory pathway pseudopilin PulG
MRFRFQQSGVTLLETTLALTIAGSIAALSFSSYQRLSTESKIKSLVGQVETYFTAAAQFYSVNCNGTYQSDGTPYTKGLLNPDINNAPNIVVYGVTAAGPLTGFLPVMKPSVIVDSSPVGGGVVVQFNAKYTDMSTRACQEVVYSAAVPGQSGTVCNIQTDTQLPSPTSTPASNPAQAQGIISAIQISVKMSTTLNASAYLGNLGADCFSQLDPTGKFILPCTATSTGAYAVWIRPVSFASPKTNTNLWMTKANLVQFNLQYTHDQMYEMNKGYTVGGSTTTQYYKCGG